ncbi:MAG: hypothetical protein R3F50_08225 [Gammaproteobacteria bacterium]|jgi:hypothetical protein
MKSEKFNNLISLTANFRAIAGIVFLAIEVEQNTHMMNAQTRDSVTKSILAIQEWNNDLATIELMDRGVAGQLATNTLEWATFRSRVEMQLRVSENELYQYEQGLFEENEFLPRTTVWQGAMNTLGFRQAWESVRNTYSVSFQDKIEEVLRNNEE